MSDFLFDLDEETPKKKIDEDKIPPRKPRSTSSFKSLEELTKKQINLLERQNHLLELLLLKKEQEKIQVIKERTEDIMKYQDPPKDHVHADKSFEEKILSLLERGRSFNISELRQYLIKFGEDEKKVTLDLLQNIINNLNAFEKEKKYWQNIFEDVYNGKIDTWDYQWTYTIWVNSGLSILPNKNLISNIGFGPDATHTTSLDSQHSKIPRADVDFPLLHPIFVTKDLAADSVTISRVFTKSSLVTRGFHKLKGVFK